jgi:GAF domain-containing protein
MRRRGPKPAKSKEAKPPGARKSPKNDGATVRDLEKRLAEALKREAESLDQQKATSEILRVISRSPTNLQPVLDAIATNAALVCDAYDAVVFLREGDRLRTAAHYGPITITLQHSTLSRGSVTEVAILDRQPVHVHDVLATEPPVFPLTAEAARRGGFRTVLSVPLLRENEAIGALAIRRREVQPFTTQQIDLLKTFADQAVIAIENVRLFNETKEALKRQTATSEILRVISSSPTDAQPVFEAIARSAVRLCRGIHGGVLRLSNDLLSVVALENLSETAADVLLSAYPLSPDRAGLVGLAIRERNVIHSPDVERDPRTAHPLLARRAGYSSALTVPILRSGDPIGVIFVTSTTPFVAEQIELLKTFADQAVIAIENVRLFTELQEKNQALTEAHAHVTEALEQQTATAEILGVISRSPNDIQPVLDAVAGSAARLCETEDVLIYRKEDDRVRLVAHHGTIGTDPVGESFALVPGTVGGRAVIECRTVHVTDILAAGDEFPESFRLAQRHPRRTIMAVPLLREGVAIGMIALRRTAVQPFTETQIALLQTFAAQAVIAIENVRLFNETKEALEQQTATAEILSVISSSPTDVQPVFDAIVRNAGRLCEAASAALNIVEGDVQRKVAEFGPESFVLRIGETRPIMRTSLTGRAMLEGHTIHIADIRDPDTMREYPDFRYPPGTRACLATPLLREGSPPVGALFIFRRDGGAFTERHAALLKTFADQAVIAIENVRLFTELQEKNQALTQAHAQVSEALERQTATSEILSVISSSPTDVQPVFDTIVESAARLCDAVFSSLASFDGEVMDFVAAHNWTPAAWAIARRTFPAPPSRARATGRAILERAVVHMPDVELDHEYGGQIGATGSEISRAVGFRSLLSVPMLRDGVPLGAIAVARVAPGPFSDNQIALLKTFADQAVIAIENVRLFTELQQRTSELTRSVEKLTALGEVSQAVSSTLDLETVLDTINERARHLAGADGGAIYEYDEITEQFHLRATRNVDASLIQALRATPLRKGEGVMGRATETREPIQIGDIAAPGVYESHLRDVLIGAGYRALLSVPIVREGQIIGSLSLNRKAPGEFSAEVIDVLRTFATQSALAIQNARLFREIEDKSRQLEAASQHKSEFLANMSHELRTPLNAIIGFSEVLSEKMFGELNERQEEYLKDIYASGTHLLFLINDILDLSKIEAGRMELELTDFHLPTALDSALTLVRERAGRRNISLQTSVDERLGEVRADERKVRQVVLNLLSNAIKFTPEGGRIEVSAVPRDGLVEVSVSDTGVGIAPGDQEAVFEEFRQVGTADKKVEGTGLGLTLCRKFVELHGGKIWVKSQVGVGSTFTFTIPVRRGE